MLRIGTILLIISFPIILINCNDESGTPDLEAPVISMSLPKEHNAYPAGNRILFNANFSDNEALATYSIDIHNTFDSHQHGKINEDPELIKFSFKENFALPATTFYDAEETINIPVNVVAGPYHFIVQSIDAAGNATSFQNGSNIEIEIYLTNESMAQINITNLINDKLELIPNTPFNVAGTISDPTHPTLQGFEQINISLEEEHLHNDPAAGRILADPLFMVNLGSADLAPFEMETGVLNLALMVNYTPDNATFEALNNEGIDELLLIIIVIDNQGNRSYSETIVLLKP